MHLSAVALSFHITSAILLGQQLLLLVGAAVRPSKLAALLAALLQSPTVVMLMVTASAVLSASSRSYSLAMSVICCGPKLLVGLLSVCRWLPLSLSLHRPPWFRLLYGDCRLVAGLPASSRVCLIVAAAVSTCVLLETRGSVRSISRFAGLPPSLSAAA